jgi:GH24 family phage-related lysozyme (muramidase)
MATYGRGQMLGSGINPESFKQDYSGFARAAETQAQGMANLGASIGGVIKDFGDQKKQINQDIAKGKSALQFAKANYPELAGRIDEIGKIFSDVNVSKADQAAAGSQMGEFVTAMIRGQEFNTEIELRKKALGIEEAQNIEAAKIKQAEIEAEANKPGSIENIAVPGGTRQMVRNPRTGVLEPIKVAGLDGANQAVKGDDLIGLVKGFERFEPKAYNDYKQTSVGYGTKGKPGEVLTEEQASERLQSELFGHAKRIEDAAALKGITLNKNQFNALTSFDFNTGRGVNLIERFGDDPQQLASKILEYNKAGGEVKGGLVKRRQIEAALFLAPEEQATGVPQVTPQNQGGIGFTPAKTAGSETYRPFTPEEIARYGSDGQVSSTGKVYPIRPPSGTEFTTNPDGSVTYKTGAGVGAKAEGVAKAQEQVKKESFRLNQANTEEAFARLDTAGTNNPLFAAGKALLAEALPASETGELAGFYERINDENSFIKMNQQRASSPTGGSAGSMTEKEWPKYQGRFSPLKTNAKKDTIAKSLSLNLLNSFEAVNGTPDDVIKLLDEKKIDQATYDNYVNDYVNNRQIARVNANGVEGKSYDWTKLNKKLLSKSTIFEAPATSGVQLLPDEQQLIDKYKTK